MAKKPAQTAFFAKRAVVVSQPRNCVALASHMVLCFRARTLIGASISRGWTLVDDPFQKRGRDMSELLAYCGLVCQTCTIYLATRKENKEEQVRMRVEISRLCRDEGMKYDPEDITDCDGCPTEGGRLFSGRKDWAIRNCARQKGVETCAHCTDYVCGTLEAFFAKHPVAKTRLDEVRSRIS
jgi:hypothetical protein